MWNKLKYVFIPLTFILFSGFFKGDGDIYFKISKSIDVFGRVFKEVSFNYVDQLNPEEFMEAGINGMLASLDPYTVFIDERRKGDIDLLTNGKYGGIGVSIGIRNDKITIVDLLDGYSAQRQGIQIGDIITKVNNVEINKDNYEDISSLVKGDPGTEVKISVLRDSAEPLVFNLVREEVKVKNLAFSDFYPENSTNVYMKLTSFTRTAGEEIQKSLTDLKTRRGIGSVVLDLRGNPGGLLDAAVDVCEKFLQKNQLVVSIKGRDSSSFKSYFAKEEPVAGKSKLVVLVDSGSASASEIVAGAMQDHDRAVIVGTESFGKGLVQTVIPLSYNTSLKITTAKYYTPSGRCIQRVDYSKNNKVFIASSSKDIGSYITDNKRQVFASGGIQPDSVVTNKIESDVETDLDTHGVFFKFANHFVNQHPKQEFYKMSNESIFKDFDAFLKNEKYTYQTSSEKQIEELIKTTEKEKYNGELIKQLEQMKNKFAELKEFEIKNHKSDIIDSIKDELFARYEGNIGKVKRTLQHDHQFQTALNITRDDMLYSHLLTHH